MPKSVDSNVDFGIQGGSIHGTPVHAECPVFSIGACFLKTTLYWDPPGFVSLKTKPLFILFTVVEAGTRYVLPQICPVLVVIVVGPFPSRFDVIYASN